MYRQDSWDAGWGGWSIEVDDPSNCYVVYAGEHVSPWKLFVGWSCFKLGVRKDARRLRSIRRNQFPQVLVLMRWNLFWGIRTPGKYCAVATGIFNMFWKLHSPSSTVLQTEDEQMSTWFVNQALDRIFLYALSFLIYEPCSKLGDLSSHTFPSLGWWPPTHQQRYFYAL